MGEVAVTAAWTSSKLPRRPVPALLAPIGPRTEAARLEDRAGRAVSRFWFPLPYWDPETEEAAVTLEPAIPLLDAAAGSHEQGFVGATDRYEAVRQALEREKYDQAIVLNCGSGSPAGCTSISPTASSGSACP